MGIPRFAYRMRDHSRTGAIGQSPEDPSKRRVAMIDGPSLAHSVYQTTRSGESIGASAFGGNVHYSVTAEAVARWLQLLGDHGFEIEGIYFDGALPAYKTEVRLSRLQSYVDKIANFRKLHDEIEKSNRRSQGSKYAVEANDHRMLTAKRDLPPPPFLTLAVIEALLNSSYADRTLVVPGEADPFCAIAALKTASLEPDANVTVFTNDSDLIVFDSAPNITVVMIDSIEQKEHESCKVLQATHFRPYDLANAVSRSKLIQPAYAMMLDPHLSFKEALLPLKVDIDMKEYHDFAESYSLIHPEVHLKLLKNRKSHNEDVLQTDPRTSELVYQALAEQQRSEGASDQSLANLLVHSGREANPRSSSAIRTASVLNTYLPVLFEDPLRSSAWKVGLAVRALAMSLLLQALKLDSTVVEYRRSGCKLNTFEVATLSGDALTVQLTALISKVRELLDLKPYLPWFHRWRLAFMQMTLADLVEENIALPESEDVISVLAKEAPLSWARLHLQAQFQAQWYSLHMLRDILLRLKAWNCADISMLRLLEEFRDFPSAVQFCDHARDDVTPEQEQWETWTKDMLTAVAAAQPANEDVVRKKKQKKRKRIPNGDSSLEALGSNPFGVLVEL